MALGSCLGEESHKGVGRVENVERAPGMGGARVSGGILGEATCMRLGKGPENSGERGQG